MRKITLDDQDLILSYLGEVKSHPVRFVLAPLWLSKGPYMMEENGNSLTIIKSTQMYNNKVEYLVSAPIVRGNSIQSTKDVLNARLTQYNADLTNKEMDFYGISYKPSQRKYNEFVYDSESYANLAGKDWASWRQVIGKSDSLFTVEYYTDKIPFTFKSKLSGLYEEWIRHRSKHVGKHTKWFRENLHLMHNMMAMAIYTKDKKHLLSFSVSQYAGGTVFFLDEKTTKSYNHIPNSFSISKLYHLLCIQYWRDRLGHPFHLQSGLGDKPYTQDGKTFDLDKHKYILRPTDPLMEIYKFEKGSTV